MEKGSAPELIKSWTPEKILKVEIVTLKDDNKKQHPNHTANHVL